MIRPVLALALHAPGRISVVLVAVALLLPQSTRAGNGGHLRTPVSWPVDTPCMTVVDRSQTTTLHFPYAIPYEDTDLTPEEFADSRTHQFVAFCRNHSAQEPLPTWLSWQDLGTWNTWLMTQGINPLELGDDDVLETHSIYKDCFVRITADDARRPITFAEVDKGVDWDTTGLPAGPYIIQGYTWEPGINIWSKRPGVVHVVDGPDLGAVGPAAALTNDLDYLFEGDTLELQGCVRAMPGSTLSGYWSLTTGAALDWLPFAQGVPLAGESIVLPFTPPLEAIEETIALRVDVTDPMQRTFAAYPMALVVVLPKDAGTTTNCGDSGSFLDGQTCGDSESGTGGVPTTGTGASSGGPITSSDSSGPGGDSASSGGAPIDTPQPIGCGCASDGGVPAYGLVALLGLVSRRRRPRFPAL